MSFESMESPEIELHNLRNAFDDHEAEIARLNQVIESERQVAHDGRGWMMKSQEAAREIDRLKELIDRLATALGNRGIWPPHTKVEMEILVKAEECMQGVNVITTERQLLGEAVDILSKNPTRPFSEFVADLKALGINVPARWEHADWSTEN